MSEHVYRDGDRVLLYGVEHSVLDTSPSTATYIWLRTLDGRDLNVDRSLVTFIPPPEPPKPVYYEGLIPRGSMYVSEGLPTNEHVAGHAFSVSNSSRIIRVKVPTGWETVWPVPETPVPQIGGEFILADDHIHIRVDSADGVVA